MPTGNYNHCRLQIKTPNGRYVDLGEIKTASLEPQTIDVYSPYSDFRTTCTYGTVYKFEVDNIPVNENSIEIDDWLCLIQGGE